MRSKDGFFKMEEIAYLYASKKALMCKEKSIQER